MSTRKATRQPKARNTPRPAGPRWGATLDQVEKRGLAIRQVLFDIQSLLKVCAVARLYRDQADVEDEHIGAALQIGADKLADLHARLDELVWTDEEIERCRKGGAL
jgi:hypothetical protein